MNVTCIDALCMSVRTSLHIYAYAYLCCVDEALRLCAL